LPFALALPTAYYLIVHWVGSWGRVAWDPTLPMDRLLPALPLAILPYLTHFLYYPATVLRSPEGESGTRSLMGLLQTMIWVALVSFAVFILLPAKVDLRDQLEAPLETCRPFLRAAFGWLHEVDPPYNAWPSLHVSHTLLAVLYMQHHQRRRALRTLLWLAWSLLAVSILLTKQHLIFDAVTGVALGVIAWHRGARRFCGPMARSIATEQSPQHPPRGNT
jgi:membrane-associated phospholipid phosphatase